MHFQKMIENPDLKNLTLIGFFLLCSYLLLYWQDPPLMLVFLFGSFFIYLFSQLLYWILNISSWREISIIFLSQLFIVALVFPRINSLELWGDEIGVIELSESPFETISHLVAISHASVPPFDYWIMHLWGGIVGRFDVYYQEFLYRIPYLFYHILATIFFFLILKHESLYLKLKESLTIKKIILITTSLGYFVHPLLFLYAVEVRFYSLAILGVVVTLYLFLTKRLQTTSAIIISGIFCLNSIFQFIIIFPLLVVSLIEKKFRKQAFFALIFHLILLKIIWPRLNMYLPISGNESIALIQSSFSNFVANLFVSSLQLTIFSIVVAVYIFKIKRKKHQFLISLTGVCLFVIAFSSYHKGYFDFHLRHFIFTLPIILFLLLSFPLRISHRFPRILILGFMVVFTVPWFISTWYSLGGQNSFSKSLVGAKQIVSKAKRENKTLMVFPISKIHDSYLEGVYSFNARTLFWYAKRYKIEISNEKLSSISCEEITSSIIVVRFWDAIDCLEKEQIEKEVIFDSNVYTL